MHRDAETRLEAEIGYGVGLGTSTVTPYAKLSAADDDTYEVGVRHKVSDAVTYNLEAVRSEGLEGSEQTLMLKGGVHW